MTSANLKVDGAAPALDWASVTESRQGDLATGSNDDSYQGGSKEDDACPPTTTGSIPNNKSDLLTFGAYVEGARPTAGIPEPVLAPGERAFGHDPDGLRAQPVPDRLRQRGQQGRTPGDPLSST